MYRRRAAQPPNLRDGQRTTTILNTSLLHFERSVSHWIEMIRLFIECFEINFIE